MNRRYSAWLAWLLAIVAILCALGGAVFIALNGREHITGFSVSGVGLGIAFPTIGAFIATRRPHNPIGWIFCSIGLSQGVDVLVTQYSEYGLTRTDHLFGAEIASWLAGWTFAPGFGLLLTLSILLFPSGHLPSRRWLVIAYLSILGIALTVVPVAVGTWSHRGPELLQDDLSQVGTETVHQLQGLGFFAILFCAVACVANLIIRFRRSTGEERVQLKWFTYAGTVVVLSLAISPFATLPQILDATLSLVLAPLLPVATAIAILKYRLYDIDRVVNKALVYGALTAVLVAGYAAGVLVMQSVLPLPEDSEIAIATSTLAMAALFRPLRGRIQALVDRRFYRARYDAAHTINAFGSALRNETNLDSLASSLIGVVAGTVQPAHTSLWLKPISGREAHG